MNKNNIKITYFILLITLISCISTEKPDNIKENGSKTSIINETENVINKEKNIKVKEKNIEEKVNEVNIIENENNKDSKENKIIIKEAPNWYNYPPTSDYIIYTLGTAKSTNMQFALDKATDWAKQKLAVMIEKKVFLVTKDFFNAANVNQRSLYLDLLNQFSRKISLNALSSLRIKERDVKAIGNYFAAFSLIELSLKQFSKNIDDAIKFYDIEFSELKSDKSINILSAELKKLKSTDFLTE